ncbi:MAG: CBS domain-containing protein, partial [Candidatus Binatia bacterium]
GSTTAKAPLSEVWFGPPHPLAFCFANETCRKAYRKMLYRKGAPILTGLPVVDRDGRLVGFLPHHGGREDWEALHPAGRAG